MLRVWMLLVVGAAAMRQVAEDASAQSAVEEEWYPDLRKEVEEVAKYKFPWAGRRYRHYIIEAVMKAIDPGTLYGGREGQRDLMRAMEHLHDEDLSLVINKAENKFQEKDQHRLTEAMINAWMNGELDKGFKEKSREEKERYLLATMQQMQQDFEVLKREVDKLARNFPEKEQHRLTEAVMNAWEKRELTLQGRISWDQEYLLKTMQELRELPVAASAVKFCSNLFREANSKAKARISKAWAQEAKASWKLEEARQARREAQEAENSARDEARREAQEAAGICHKVLTGELGADDGPKWAEKAANSSQPEGQHYQLGRLQKVNATEKAWKVSLKNVCKDECHALVEEIQKEAKKVFEDVQNVSNFGRRQKQPSYEEACANRVVKKVEAEILTCCADSCGWNGRACMYWPFLNSTEKGQWEAECCTEFNILKNSSRATMCDATLTGKEIKEVIRDVQPNRPKDRRMIGQDPDSKGTSFLQSEDTNGPTPSPEYKPISATKGKCPKPLDLGEVHEKLKHQWRTTNFVLAAESAREKINKDPHCEKPPADTIGNCTAFLPLDVNGKYVCYGECLESVPVKDLPKMDALDAKIPGNTGLLYVHETIYNR